MESVSRGKNITSVLTSQNTCVKFSPLPPSLPTFSMKSESASEFLNVFTKRWSLTLLNGPQTMHLHIYLCSLSLATGEQDDSGAQDLFAGLISQAVDPGGSGPQPIREHE